MNTHLLPRQRNEFSCLRWINRVICVYFYLALTQKIGRVSCHIRNIAICSFIEMHTARIKWQESFIFHKFVLVHCVLSSRARLEISYTVLWWIKKMNFNCWLHNYFVTIIQNWLYMLNVLCIIASKPYKSWYRPSLNKSCKQDA